MKIKIKKFFSTSLLVCVFTNLSFAQNQLLNPGMETLTGDAALACEAILCLSSSTRPNECAPSLKKYFSIKKFVSRKNFLKSCPAVSTDVGLQAFVNDIVNGAGQCDVATLNTITAAINETGMPRISNQLPTHCVNYYSNEYTDFKEVSPKYVGTPDREGYWVEANQYEASLLEYKARQASKDAQEKLTGNSGS